MRELAYKLLTLTSDRLFIKIKYYIRLNKIPNLDKPKTFNEKLQWLKLNDRRPIYTTMVDKYRVRDYVSNKIGKEYLIPLIGVWDDPDEIDFDSLTNQFVLKCNHNSGTGMYICKDKSKIDEEEIRHGLRQGLKEDYFIYSREWPYKNIPKKIICEDYIGDNPNDYKIFCFNGKARYVLVCSDRFTSLKETFFDLNWNVAPFKRPKIDIDPNIEKPHNLEKMIELANKLSKNIPFLRVDFYEVNKMIFFGELTFFPAGGFSGFEPAERDYKLGKMIKL